MLLALTVMWGSALFSTELALVSVSPSAVVAGRLLIALGVLGVVVAFSQVDQWRRPLLTFFRQRGC